VGTNCRTPTTQEAPVTNAVLIRLNLPATAEAARRVRRALDAEPSLGDPDLLFLLRLLLTELVTNAVRHAGLRPDERVEVRIEARHGVVSVLVSDRGVGPDALPLQSSPDRPSGRGLLLVTAIADRWGLNVADGTSVWFELDVDDAGRPTHFDASLRRAAESASRLTVG
jgi:two-component sensor histidine kinase